MPNQPNEKEVSPILWRMGDDAAATRLSPRTISRLRAAGRLPAADASYGRLPRWRPSTIENWISNGGLSEAMSG
jgi:hypothetical protein